MGLTAIKDFLVRKVARSFILKFVDGHKTNLMRVVQGISMLITGLTLAVTGVDGSAGTELVPYVDKLNANWILALNFLAQFGLEFALSDKDAKARGK